jgi:peptidyl-prolyl cis-trans isomerase SurA
MIRFHPVFFRISLILSLCFFAYPLASSAAPGKKLPLLDRMIASVNNEAITASELNKQTELLLVRLRQTDTALPPLSELRKQVLEKMVLEKLQLQLASQEGVVIDDTALEKAIQDIAQRDSLSVSQLQQFLEEQAIPFSQFRQTIKTEMTLSKLHQKEIGQHISVSNRDIEQFLESPAGLDQNDAEYRLGHILIALPDETPSTAEQQKLEAKAETIVKELKGGSDFAKTAIAKSAGQQALTGGDLGWRKMAEMPTLFSKVVATLRAGEVYGPIRDSSGFHIIKLFEKRNLNAKKVSAKEQRNKAMEFLYQRKFDEQLVSWLRRLRADAEIKIYLNEA